MAAESRVYFGKMPKDIDEDDLRKHLSIYGPIVDLTVKAGFAIVRFESDKDALDVVSVLGKRRFLGAELRVSMYVPRSKLQDTTPRAKPPNAETIKANGYPRTHASREYSTSVHSKNTVVVTYLNKETCWQELKDFGRRAGSVAYCEINKFNRRIGFIKYESKEFADNAVAELDGKELMNCRVRVMSLEDYDHIRQAEPLLQAGRMRSCSPGRQPSVQADRKPYYVKHNHHNDIRGRSPARHNTSMVENARHFISSTSGQ
ncbi:uncharacterized protein B0H18DRAFT_19416 [Fomitopsis serialis]|uniref:uncharacterized protein n=1 Tax=Fomitopsis serialis TaxID=139415 RepID=UPI002007C5CE|nr:uncharacterized protein B0H18DRAFT_19416 [Neoantrodia serialis]KAH9938566.1 hypothetical protein B0H18DRAFT_19416 [Neoantrodia serialis]